MREAILDAAEEILSREGAEGVTCELVAHAADVSVQTVYNRVGRKNDLLMALLERALEQNHRFMDAAYAQCGTAAQRLDAALHGYVRFAFESRDAFLMLAVPPKEAASPRLVELIRLQNGRLTEALKAGQAEGLIDRSLDPATCATMLWTMWNGLLLAHLNRDIFGLDKTSMDTALERARSILLRGMAAEKPATREA